MHPKDLPILELKENVDISTRFVPNFIHLRPGSPTLKTMESNAMRNAVYQIQFQIQQSTVNIGTQELFGSDCVASTTTVLLPEYLSLKTFKSPD